MLAPARSRCRWVLLGTGYPLKLGTGCGERMRQAVGSRLRGAVPALAGRLGEGLGFRASREGMGLFAFNARFGTVPLPLGCFWGQATP